MIREQPSCQAARLKREKECDKESQKKKIEEKKKSLF